MSDQYGHGGGASERELAARVARLEARLLRLEFWAVRVHETFKRVSVPDPMMVAADTIAGGPHPPPPPPQMEALVAELVDILREQKGGHK